jgi:hypothetical protein
LNAANRIDLVSSLEKNWLNADSICDSDGSGLGWPPEAANVRAAAEAATTKNEYTRTFHLESLVGHGPTPSGYSWNL